MRTEVVGELRALLERASDDEFVAALSGTSRMVRNKVSMRPMKGGAERRVMMRLGNGEDNGGGGGGAAGGDGVDRGGGRRRRVGGRSARRGEDGRHGL